LTQKNTIAIPIITSATKKMAAAKEGQPLFPDWNGSGIKLYHPAP
jgi:hypothetical protein